MSADPSLLCVRIKITIHLQGIFVMGRKLDACYLPIKDLTQPGSLHAHPSGETVVWSPAAELISSSLVPGTSCANMAPNGTNEHSSSPISNSNIFFHLLFYVFKGSGSILLLLYMLSSIDNIWVARVEYGCIPPGRASQ